MGFGHLGSAAKRRFEDDVYSALTRADIESETALSIANAPQHLQVLAKCTLVHADRRRIYAFHRVADSNVYRLTPNFRRVAEQNDSRLAVTAQKNLGARDAGVPGYDIVHASIADPRVAEEYAAGHPPRAIDTPLAERRSRITIGPIEWEAAGEELSRAG